MVIAVQNDSFFEREQITNSTKIVNLLAQLSKHYSPLTVQIQGHKEQYTSCIVKVDKPYVLFDDLMSSIGHERLLSARKIHAKVKLDGVDMSFTATLDRVDGSKNSHTYYMNLPRELEYLQRRQTYRVRIPMSRELRVFCDNGSDSAIVGVLHDLSHGGASKLMPAGEINLEPGCIYECAIQLPGDELLYCSVEICYLKKAPSRRQQLIGIKFEHLSNMQSQLIGRSVSQLEMEKLRMRAENLMGRG